tara:strand:- start:256 stop:663 length:408 start_codon:yes stop_codon:yes gene_type:complete
MNEKEFFLELFPQQYELLDIKNFKDFEGEPFHFVKHIDELDVLRSPEEGGVCECVNGNTNKALVLYFQSILHQDIELPIFINSENQIMDGHHRIQAYNLMGRKQIPVYRNKSYRIHGFCWKKGIEGRRRLRHKTW